MTEDMGLGTAHLSNDVAGGGNPKLTHWRLDLDIPGSFGPIRREKKEGQRCIVLGYWDYAGRWAIDVTGAVGRSGFEDGNCLRMIWRFWAMCRMMGLI